MRLLGLLCLLLLFRIPAGTQELRVGVYDFAPLIQGPEQEPSGLFIDLIEHIGKAEGWTLRYHADSWANLLTAIKDGTIDILACVGYSAERTSFLDFSDQVVFVDSGILLAKPGTAIVTPHELRGKSIACLSGSIYTAGLESYLTAFDIKSSLVRFDSYEAAIQALRFGLADAAVCTDIVGRPFAERYDLAIAPIFFSPVAITFAVAKGKNGTILAALNTRLKALKEDPKSLYYLSLAAWVYPKEKGLSLHRLRLPLAIAGFVLFVLLGALGYARYQVAKRTEALEKINADLAMAQRYARLGSWTWDVTHDRLTWSDQMYELFGIDKISFTGKLPDVIASAIHPEDRDKVDASNRSVADTGKPIPVDYRIVLPDGRIRTVWAEAGNAERDSWNRITRLSGYVQDITERKRTEDELRASMEQNKTLMRELLHRTKNNMFLISGMLQLRGRSLADPRLEEEFREIGARIDALALVQESLYKSRNISTVDFGEYLGALIARQMVAFVPGDRIRADIAIQDVAVGIQLASPLALAVNELALNSLKHAFRDGRKGSISVEGRTAREPEASFIEIRYRDDGPGFPEGFNPESAQSLGLSLIRTIIREQLAGSLEFLSGPGMACRIRIPKPMGVEA